MYGLAVVRIPTNRPLRRRVLPDRAFKTAEADGAVAARVQATHATNRPVLIGTRSVEASEHLSRLLDRAGLAHTVLNARQDTNEADIVAQAGLPGKMTVATNMAGRGTDIKLGPGVESAGGLHVIATERHESGRIDRQLFGRAARQGDPGSCEALISLEDDLATHARQWYRLARLLAGGDGLVPGWIARFVVRRAQRGAERFNEHTRADLLKFDDQLDSTLAFSGRSE